MDTCYDRNDDLEDARESLRQAIDLIRAAVRGTPVEDYAEAYIIPTLVMCQGESHAYLGSQPANIDELIRAREIFWTRQTAVEVHFAFERR